MTPPRIVKNKTPDDRRAIFNYLDNKGFLVPDHDVVHRLWHRHGVMIPIVVYMPDGTSQKLRMVDAYQKGYKYHYASLYVGEQTGVSRSKKLIQIGDRRYIFEMESKTDWKSNRGSWTSCLLLTEYGIYNDLKMPAFSLDTVGSHAIDFDFYPSLKGTILYKSIDRKEISKLIRKAMRHYDGQVRKQ